MIKKRTQKVRHSEQLIPPSIAVSENVVIRPTGIPELDSITDGGIPVGSAILLTGAAGTGKTILTLQWLFSGYDKYKEAGIYISLTEPIAKTLRNARNMEFFKQEHIGPMQIYFTDLRAIGESLELSEDEFTHVDVDRLLDAIRQLVITSGAKRVVLDSITAIAYRLQTVELLRKFIFELGTLLAQIDATLIMTSEVSGEGLSVFGVEEFIADGIISLSRVDVGQQSMYSLAVIKLRAGSHSRYSTMFRISNKGIVLSPRVISGFTYAVSGAHIPTGIVGLDAMTNGGLMEGTVTFLTGASGTGKTILGMQVLVEGLRRGERCMLVSYEESLEQLMLTSKAFGWDLARYEKDGFLKILTMYPEQKFVDEHIDTIVSIVAEFAPKRLVLDSVSALVNTFSEEYVRDFTGRLSAYLKTKGITTVFTNAAEGLVGGVGITGVHLSTMVDNIIMLRYVEIESALRHAILVLKMRGSKHDKKMREFVFGDAGVEVLSDFKGYEGVLSGSTRKVTQSIEEQLHTLYLRILGPMGEKLFAEQKLKGIRYDMVAKLIAELGEQGIISAERKAEFERDAQTIFGGKQ